MIQIATHHHFARHDDCDCLLVVSGYNSRNGVVNNYVKHKNSKERQEHLRPTLEELRNNPNETTVALSQVLEGQKQEAKIGNMSPDNAGVLGVKRKAEIKISRSSALHMDNSGHFSGTGFTKNGHDDAHPLTVKEITNIPDIVKNANENNTIFKADNVTRGKQNIQRFYILGNADTRQIVIVDRTSSTSLNVVTSYKVSKSRYERYLKEINK